jgi:hypothetical protein
MHCPPGKYANGLGFIGPPGAPTETSGGVPIVSYTSSSGWAAKPILATGYYQPTVVATGDPVAPQYDSGVPPGTPPPDYTGPGGVFTREQIQDMIDRARAADAELLARQGREEGDGYATELERQAAMDAARAAAIAAGGAPGAPGEGAGGIAPWVIAAALIYFMAG